jgi:hypothetical protein
MRTFSKASWDEAQEAWLDFSDEWRDARHTMAMQGVLYPPAGDKCDSWEDDQPSQRAVLIRAIRETPQLLERCMRKAHSWEEVIGRLFRERDEWRAELAREYEEPEPGPDHFEAVQTLGAIVARIADSAGVER